MKKAVVELKLKCPDCKSAFIYFKRTTQSFVCRRCGNEWAKVEVKQHD